MDDRRRFLTSGVVELGYLFETVRTDVTIVEMRDALLPREDPDVAEAFTDIAAERHEIHTGHRVTAVEAAFQDVLVRVEPTRGPIPRQLYYDRVPQVTMAEPRQARRDRLFEQLDDDVDAAFLAPSESLFYFTGLSMHKSERPALAVVTPESPPALVVPQLEVDRALDALPDADCFTYGDATDPVSAARPAFADLVDDRGISGPVAAEYRATRLLELDLFADRFGFDDVRDLGPTAAALRARKDDTELETMRRAAAITDEILQATFEEITPGMREVDVERELRRRVLDSEADEYGVGIVTSGPRTALAHTNTGVREIETGDLLMIDMGVVLDGYYSDITRTVAVGEPGEEAREIYDVVRTAARRSRETVAEGVAYQELDRAAREVIEDAGYGEYFPHRVGHGLGLEGHEPPYLVEGNDETVAVGNAFTIEPGVYVPELGGVRIEDDVVVTENGAESLTSTTRELQVL